jgi:hypothetical protein
LEGRIRTDAKTISNNCFGLGLGFPPDHGLQRLWPSRTER